MGIIFQIKLLMFKFAAIAVLASVAVAQDDEALDALKSLVTMEGCEMKSDEVLAEEEGSEELEATCKAACTPEELVGMTEEEQEEAAAEWTEEQTGAVVACAINCGMCANFGAVEESASAMVMGAAAALTAAALF